MRTGTVPRKRNKKLKTKPRLPFVVFPLKMAKKESAWSPASRRSKKYCLRALINEVHPLDSNLLHSTDKGNKHRSRAAGPARLISDLLNPLVLPPLVFIVSGWIIVLELVSISWIGGAALLFYTLIPFLALVYLLNTKAISSLDIPNRSSRPKLFVLSIVCSVLAFFFFNATISFSNPVISIISLVFLLNLSIAYGINTRWKMSIHTATLTTGGTILLFLLSSVYASTQLSQFIFALLLLLLLLSLLVWSRLHLKVHTTGELLGGIAAGFLFTISELFLLVQLW